MELNRKLIKRKADGTMINTETINERDQSIIQRIKNNENINNIASDFNMSANEIIALTKHYQGEKMTAKEQTLYNRTQTEIYEMLRIYQGHNNNDARNKACRLLEKIIPEMKIAQLIALSSESLDETKGLGPTIISYINYAKNEMIQNINDMDPQIIEAARIQRQRKIESSMYHIGPSVKNLSEPTYRFQVGEKVRVGNLKNAEIDEILDNGKMYVIKYDEEIRNAIRKVIGTKPNYMVELWPFVRPITNGQSQFVETFGFESDLKTINKSVESLIHDYYHFGINMNPEYQRDYVWDQSDKEKLIRSIFMGADIGRFALITDYSNPGSNPYGYEILDGKQRLNAIIEYFENRWPYDGVYYNDLSWKDRHRFANHLVQISYLDKTETNRDEIIQQFIIINQAGRHMSDDDIQNAINLLKTSK